jgi:predicted phosphodiesterase
VDISKLPVIFLLTVMINIVLLSILSTIPFFAAPTIHDNSSTAYAQTLPNFNFGAVGDWGCNSNTQSTVNNIVSKNTELVLGLGDYSYESTANCWLNIVDPIDHKMEISIGNHDDVSSSLLNQYMNHFSLSKQFYSFNYQNVHFVVMSTELTHTAGSEQYNFVNSDLSNAAANPNIDWIVVLYHKVAYSSPTTHSGLSTLRDTYHPLFDKYGVDVVLQGHNHNYQRSFPIKYNSNNPSSPIIADANTNNYNDPQGQIFATVGTGGIGFYGLSGKASYIVYQQASNFGFLNIDIIEGGTTLAAKFYSNDGIVRDQFTIAKSTTTPSSKYHYEPYLTLSGSNRQDVPSSSSLQLTRFSVATWFMTNQDYSSNAYIVNKGGFGTETAGRNMNYGIWMTSTERIQAGFETSTGPNYFATSPASYNDGQWHYAVVTYGGSTVTLYIDGVRVSSLSTSATPDNTGTQPVRIGANSLALNGFFTGNVDEVRIWNRALTSTEVANAYNNGAFSTSGQVLYRPF